jgi:hypothetical protein
MEISSEEVATIQGKRLIIKTIQVVGRFCVEANKPAWCTRIISGLFLEPS